MPVPLWRHRTCLQRGDVLLVCFHGRIQHRTVLFGLSADRILLFDSDGMRFVRRTTLRVAEQPRGTLILKSLVPRGATDPMPVSAPECQRTTASTHQIRHKNA